MVDDDLKGAVDVIDEEYLTSSIHPETGEQHSNGRHAYIDGAFGDFIRKLHETPLIDPEEEPKIIRAAQNGDAKAIDRLVRANAGFVLKQAMRYSKGDRNLMEELFNAGLQGIYPAIQKFSFEHGVRFLTYASYWIRAYIFQAIIQHTKHSRFFYTGVLKYMLGVRRARQALHIPLGEGDNISPEIVAQYAEGISADMAKEAKMALEMGASRVQSLNAPRRSAKDGEGRIRQDEIVGATARDTEEIIQRHQSAAKLRAVLDKNPLSPIEAEVIKRRFGLGVPESTLQEVGDSMCLTRERVRQLQERALEKIKKAMLQQGFTDDDCDIE